jgi:RND family efflux transporter MFP subunit
MGSRAKIITGAVLATLVAAGFVTRDRWMPEKAAAQSPRPKARAVPVDVTVAVKKPMPITLDVLGTVVPVASVAIKARLETEITAVHFTDGQEVKQGDLLFTLDGSVLQAQAAQTEGVLRRDKAQLEQAERDVKRNSELLVRNAGTALSVENAKTQTDMLRGTIAADEAALKNLRVQLGWTKIYASISGRISAANVKVGNFVRPADTASLAVINQLKPIYVAFAVPQQSLAQMKRAMAAGTARVEARIAGEPKPSTGKLAMIDNTVDPATGMVMARALMDNADEALWPGTLVNVALTLRTEEDVAVPAVAVQTSQSGTYVFVVKDQAARTQPVTVARTSGAEVAISQGLVGGETVVTDGQMLLSNGTKVAPRAAKAGS